MYNGPRSATLNEFQRMDGSSEPKKSAHFKAMILANEAKRQYEMQLWFSEQQ
jgi:hypothetical protein